MNAKTGGILMWALAAFCLWLPANAQPNAASTRITLSTAHMGHEETALGDIVADALREDTGADMAFVPAAEFSDSTVSISPGPVTLAALKSALENPQETIAVLRLSGEQITKALQQAFTLYPVRYDGYLQYSGFRATLQTRGGMAAVTAIEYKGKPLQLHSVYLVAAPVTLANGAQGYFKFWSKRDIDKSTKVTLADALQRWLAAHPVVQMPPKRLSAGS